MWLVQLKSNISNQWRSQLKNFGRGQIFCLHASNSILFGTPPLKAQNDWICYILWWAWIPCPPIFTSMSRIDRVVASYIFAFLLAVCLHEFVRLVTRAPCNLISKPVNLQLKLGCLSFQNKIEIFQRNIFSKTFCHFPTVTMRTNDFRKETIAGHEVKKYKSKLQDYRMSSKPDLTICRSCMKPCFAFLVNPFSVNVVGGGNPVCQLFVTN